ncbi:MAG: hypothetical protein WD794_01815 [Mycobacteriales bacterium]
MSRVAARVALLSLTTSLAGVAALVLLPPVSGSPSLTTATSSTSTSAAALAAPATVQQARALPADVPAAAVELLTSQQAAGLDCELSARNVPLCMHGADAEPAPHDHASHGHAGETAEGTSSGSTGSTGTIGCYGDGTSGNRVRAVYARPQSAADRYSASVGSIRSWAAGVSSTFDASAAVTGGRRHVRFATTSGSSCSLTVLNIALPDSAFSSFRATIDAMQARGLDAKGSKYLIWADTTGYCGIATTYADDKPGLDNLNNNGLPSYARVDRSCWGKVEAHEVVHMLGGVQRTAPNATAGFHCNDGLEVMCYNDRTAGSTQKAVCAKDRAHLLDCRNNDYYSTAAPKGSYLQTHWNVARSSFLAPTLSDPAPAASSPAPAPSQSPSPKATTSPQPRPVPTVPSVPAVPSLAPVVTEVGKVVADLPTATETQTPVVPVKIKIS